MDGTKQIDVNVSSGTIFSVYRRVTPPGTPVQLKDFLQPGKEQVRLVVLRHGYGCPVKFRCVRKLGAAHYCDCTDTRVIAGPCMRLVLSQFHTDSATVQRYMRAALLVGCQRRCIIIHRPNVYSFIGPGCPSAKISALVAFVFSRLSMLPTV